MFSFYKDNHIRAFRILNNHRISPVHLIVISSAEIVGFYNGTRMPRIKRIFADFFRPSVQLLIVQLSNCPIVQLPYSIYVVYLNHFHKFILIFIPIISIWSIP